MNKQSQVVSLRTTEIIENEAADWLAKLDSGKMSSADRRALKVWLTRDPDHVHALKSLASIWSDMDFLLNEFPVADKTGTPVLLSLLLRTKLRRTKQWSLALVTIFLCAIGLFVWMADQPVTTETAFYVTSVGKRQVEKFSDGSSVHLNTNSMIESDYSKSARIVRLLRGEAMFDVAHDSARPFIVFAGDSEIKAIGTKFVVRMTSENIVVTVTDGQVQLSKRTKRSDTTVSTQEQEVTVVSEGEEAEVHDKIPTPQLKEIQDDELKRRLSWLDGQLIFNNERLEQVIKEISRYVPDRIIIDDAELRDVRISGRFVIGDTDALLEAIEVSFKVKADHVDDQIIHLSR
jgi:transmembrane sensor